MRPIPNDEEEVGFTVTSASLAQGYEKIKPDYATNFGAEERRERDSKIMPWDAQPVEGGFVPLNNVFDRI